MIRLFSDLHLEMGPVAINKCVDICKRNRTKYIVLAGDITNFEKKEKNLSDLIKSLSPYTPEENIIYILGNHEYHRNKKKCYEETQWHYEKLCNNIGIRFLENKKYITDDYIFYGSTLWSKRKSTEINDIHNNSVNMLQQFITETKKSNKPIVVISHHIPSFSLIDKKYRTEESSTNSIYNTFASNLDHLIKSPIDYWVYGHTHTSHSRSINGTRLYCNPHGYPSESFNAYKDCIIG